MININTFNNLSDFEKKILTGLKTGLMYHEYALTNARLLSEMNKITYYKARKIIKNLISLGFLKKESVGFEWSEDWNGEYYPPQNGYTLTDECSDFFKYNMSLWRKETA